MPLYRICLVDDHELLRESLAALLDAQSDIAVVGQASDGFQALRLARDLQPDLILMDISMPICGGLEATRLILDEMPHARILMLTVHEEEERLFESIIAGACGYILKNTNSATFLHFVRRALAGEVVLQPKLGPKLFREFTRLATDPAHPNVAQGDLELSVRERSVLDLVARQATNDEIAQQLSISVHTVKSHISSILRKLQVANRQQAAAKAIRKRLLKRPK